jgi:phospholipase/carboxylesterase
MATQGQQELEYRSRRQPDSSYAVVLFHGFGADSSDLESLAPELDPSERLSFYFPQAPYPITVGGQKLGRGWFPRNDRELQEALYGSYFHKLGELDPPGLHQSAQEGAALIDSLGVAWERVFVGGFSQGAIVATEIALEAERPVAGLLLFSGSLMARERWVSLLRSRSGDARFPYFQAHGTSDPILPFPNARELNMAFTQAGYEGEFHPFPGGHEIAPHVLSEAASFLVLHMSL